MKSPEPKSPANGLTREKSLALIPEKNRDAVENRMESGTVVLSYPIVLRPFFERLAMRFSKEPAAPRMRKLALDELGTWVWDRVDGKRRVRELVSAFCREFDVLPAEAEASITRFLFELGKRGLIGMR